MKPISGKTTITISRLTDIGDNPSEDILARAIEELRDESALKSETTKAAIANMEKNLFARLDFESASRETAIIGLKDDILTKIRRYSDENYNLATGDIEGVQRQVDISFGKIEAVKEEVSSLNVRLQTSKAEYTSRLDTLSRDHSVLIRLCLDKISELENKISSYEKRTDLLENRPVTYAAPRMASVPSVTTALMEASLNGIRSALNTETQVRRREDAQIKALLKRLLGKYERLEDWIAGESPDFAESVIVGLREEMKRQDDILGRIHLENIVRINELREKHINV